MSGDMCCVCACVVCFASLFGVCCYCACFACLCEMVVWLLGCLSVRVYVFVFGCV